MKDMKDLAINISKEQKHENGEYAYISAYQIAMLISSG